MNTRPFIQPISTAQEALIRHRTLSLISETTTMLNRTIPEIEIEIEIEIHFDLKGSAAGMYCSRNDRRWFRYNPYLFAKYFTENLENTVPHEVAHYLVDAIYIQKRVHPHGVEWRAMMQLLGGVPERTHRFDLEGIPVKRQRRHRYRCGCQEHELSTTRHNRAQRNKHQRYHCRSCGEALIYTGQ